MANYYNPWMNNNSGQYVMPYPPQFYQNSAPQMQQSYSQQSQPMVGADYVLGEAAAKAYNVPAGKMMILMDSEDQVFYIKTVDAFGRPFPLVKYRYQEEQMTQNLPAASQAMDPNKYVTKDELDDKIKARIEELMK